MASSVCLTRLRKEYKEIQKKPVDNIRAAPKESNILEWHYVIEGPQGSVYEGGWFHGTLTFPTEYPYKPPSIQMFTPNGRFKVNTRLCLSMSDFHPETWNPMWSVGTILMGLYSFMLEDSPTYGSIVTSDTFKRKCARESLEFDCKNKIFCELFSELADKHEEDKKNAKPESVAVSSEKDSVSDSKSVDNTSWTAIIGVLCAIIACTWAVLALSL
jgi:ubiquitin-conjugating enzyme E2 J2